MEKFRITRRIGELAATSFIFGWLSVAHAASPEVTVSAIAQPDQVTIDGSVSLRITVRVDGNASVGEPQFKAPDFEVINEYRGQYVESYYENGQFGMRNNQQITKVLKPTKTGDLTIGGIQVPVNGHLYGSANTFTIHVLGSGAGTPPPRGYGGGGIGLRGAGKHTNAGPGVIVRAEVDKDKVYKGEQVIVSYYLYRKVRVFNIQVDKYPTLNGFLREDLEMPVLGSRLDTERVVLDGVPYERSLLVRYAVYPLTEGKLKIDDLGLKYNYYGGPNAPGEDDDPFMSFFQQMAPHAGAMRSDPVTITVAPLPEDGKPNSFTGGVGDFNVASAVDKYEVRANEPITLTVKVEGRGNVEGIAEPKASWPENLELYDSKGRAGKVGRGGVGDKTFEFLLIPRAPGKLELPAIEFAYFDPAKKTYVTKKTEPLSINVLEPAPGSATAPPPRAHAPNGAAPGTETPGRPSNDATLGLKPPTDVVPEAIRGIPFWRWLYWGCGAVFALFLGLVGRDLILRTRASAQQKAQARAREIAKSWQTLKSRAASAANAPWNEVSQSYEQLCSHLFDGIDQVFGIGARAFPRAELREMLLQRQVAPEICDKMSNLLEFAELVRFAGSAGSPQETAARQQLAQWVTDGETIVRALGNPSSRK